MTTFNHIYDIGQKNVVSSIEDNIKNFLDWGFLNIGGFVNTTIPTSGTSGPCFLKPMSDPNFPQNTVWETVRKDWVYESEVNYNGLSPINISGVYVNNTFLPAPSGSGSYSYTMNYPQGRIHFKNPISASSKAALNYSYRYVQVYKASESLWWKELQSNTYNVARFGSDPDYNITANHRVQMPAIVIELNSRTSMTPYELGTSENILMQDILLHIFTETATHRNSIIDALLLQKDKGFYLNNISLIIKDNRNSLDYKGQPNPNRFNYDQLQTNQAYFLKKCYIHNAVLGELNMFSNSLYNGIVRWTLEILP